MRRSILPTRSVVLLVGALGASPAAAQNIDQAIEAYNDDKHVDAAVLFFDVIQNSDDPDARVKSEYYIAQSLNKAGFLFPSMRFYGDVFNAGTAHPYFLKAAEGLLKVSEDVEDDTLIPEVINKGYTPEFSKLNKRLNEINYMIGLITQRRGDYEEAARFLEAVDKTSPLYVKARYLLAILAVKTAVAQQAESYQGAIDKFSELEQLLEGKTDERSKKLYRLAILGKARAYYSQGDWAQSIKFYEKVPRFSDDWYDAMFESGWAYWQNGDFGKALGMVHAIQSPYFDDRYRAESWVLKSTTYFQLCHFDRARKALDVFFALYEPIAERVKPWLEGQENDDELIAAIANGHEKLPNEIRNQVVNNRRFKRFKAAVEQVDRELKLANDELPEGGLKTALVEMLNEERGQRVALAAALVREQLKRESVFLEDFLGQARIIKFETADAERKMLEGGKDITKGPRARGPRPIVPNARYQYWAFSGEYWIDELGFYEHSIKNECIPDIFGGDEPAG